MIYTLPPISLCLWFAEAASLLFLSALLIVANSRNRYPQFANLIHFTTGGCTFLLVVARFAPYQHFMWSYFAYRLAWDVMAALVVREVYANTFGPALALPQSMPRRLGVGMVIVMTSAASVAGA